MERIPLYIKACFVGYVITGAPVILVISIRIKPIKILKKVEGIGRLVWFNPFPSFSLGSKSLSRK